RRADEGDGEGEGETGFPRGTRFCPQARRPRRRGPHPRGARGSRVRRALAGRPRGAGARRRLIANATLMLAKLYAEEAEAKPGRKSKELGNSGSLLPGKAAIANRSRPGGNGRRGRLDR